MNAWIKKSWKENKSLILFLCLMFVFRSAVADWNDVPTGSMQPTIVEGDRLLVNKMAYDLRIPFTHISLIKIADPQTGDIVIFDSVASNKKLVKRVVGIPDDIVSMQNNVLFINDKRLDYVELPTSETENSGSSPDQKTINKSENLGGIKHLVKLNVGGSKGSSFDPVKVPKDHYLVLGDNRDNSADSRMIGFVPREEIVGRTKSVVLSLDYDNYFLPRSERFLREL